MKIDSKILDFIGKHRLSVLTTILKEGTPHSATMHYASNRDPWYFIFLTERNSRKCKHFKAGQSYLASLVIGFSEEEWVELQMEGEVKIMEDKEELENAWGIYAGKFTGMDKYKESKDDILLKFVPKWWRYTEFQPEPPKVISSD